MNKLSKRNKVIRIVLVFLCLISFFVLLFSILYNTGVWQKLNSVEKLRDLIASTGIWGRCVFVLLQFLQVTIIPIPSTILTVAGAVAFGPLQGALLSLAGILFGSAVAFWIGQRFGKRVVCFMVGDSMCEKWTRYLTKAKYSFVFMMLFPMFPDDILCLVAGLTNMTWTFFMVTNIVARPVGIFLTCFLGSGDLIPYSGWGLLVWAGLVVFAGAVIYLSIKYQKQIERFVIKSLKNKKS